MVLFLDYFFHISLQMLRQNIAVRLLFQQASEKFVHVVEQILKCLVQFLCIDQGCFQHPKVDSFIVLKGEQCRIDILDINLRIFHLRIHELFKSIEKNGRVIRNDNIGCQRRKVIQFFQPAGPDQPV